MKIIPKNKLIIIIILLMMFFLTMLSSNVYASSISDIFTKADDFVKNGQNTRKSFAPIMKKRKK